MYDKLKKLEKIIFEDGSEKISDGLFIAFGSASSVDFAKKTGIITDSGYVVVDPDQMTNLEGIFAAGACTLSCKTINQIATSVGQGALAGKKILEYLYSPDCLWRKPLCLIRAIGEIWANGEG